MSQNTSDRQAPTKDQETDESPVKLLTGPQPDGPESAISNLQTDPHTTLPPDEEVDELIGSVVANRYRVLKKMGEGGMGTVYLAEHIAIEKKVALKVLLHEYARKADLKERFLQEAKAAAKIGHENIVDITDFGHTPNGSVFFAMEFLEGEDLSRAIKAGPMQWARAKPILLQICRAMGAAHSNGIIHRDVKPENIYLIDREGRGDFIKVLDFGIAKMSNVDEGERRLTRTGMIFGTPEYMSPEQAQGHRPDHRVDIYALGVIMYEMLTGEVPFKADTFMGILTKHIFESPVPPSSLREGIPIEVEEIVLRAMAKDRDERYRSMTEMAAAITKASGRMTRPTGDQSTVIRRSVTPAPDSEYSLGVPLDEQPAQFSDEIPRSRGKLVAAIVVLALLAGGGAYALFGGKRADPPPKRVEKPVLPPKVTPPPKVTTPPKVTPPPKTVVAPSKTVRIEITSMPSGARIYVDGKRRGRTNRQLELPRDEEVQIKLRKRGFKDYNKKLRLDDGARIKARLSKKRPPKRKTDSGVIRHEIIEPKWGD